MLNFRSLLTTCLFVFALFSAQGHAASVQSEVSKGTDSSFTTGYITDLSKVLLRVKPTLNKTPKKTHQTDFTAHQPRLTAHNPSLFLSVTQSEPQYDVIFEFFEKILARQIYLQPLTITNTQPWYTIIYKNKKSRLSGWKDANLLYCSVITYHV